MKVLYRLFPLAILLMLIGSGVDAESIAAVHYTTPVNRYGHFALGWPHEYARLTATTDSGRLFSFQLPEDEVFEDLAPRLVKLSTHDPEEVLTIVSHRHRGARLVLFKLLGDGLTISAQSLAIGTPNRWLNPVGVADLDGDGQAEIAAVITPHIGGILKVYKKKAGVLAEIAALPDFSNHVYGSPELALSAPVLIAGRSYFLVPNMARLHLRIMSLQNSRLVESGRCALSAPITEAITLIAPAKISINGPAKQQVIDLKNCLQSPASLD